MSNKEIGIFGENMAISHLSELGYEIMHRNWRYKHLEIDIIAKNNKILVFVEVKTRNNNHYGEPEIAVNQKKENLIANAGAAYMRQIGHNWEVRFDIISIIYKNEKSFTIKHFEDAFFPG